LLGLTKHDFGEANTTIFSLAFVFVFYEVNTKKSP
jgi:hypothetical protein